MQLETGVQIFAIIHLSVIGLSHIVAHKAWAEFFILLRDKGHPGVFVVAFMSLGFGSIIAAFHWEWTGIPLLLTLLGWAQVLKALVYFCVPGYGHRKLGVVSLERSRMFAYPGVFLLVVSGLLLYHVLQTA